MTTKRSNTAASWRPSSRWTTTPFSETSARPGTPGTRMKPTNRRSWSGPASPWPTAASAPAANLFDPFKKPQQLRTADDMLAGAGVELAEEVLEVPLHRFLPHCHGLGDFLVGEIAGQQFQHLPLLGRQHHAGHRPGAGRAALHRRAREPGGGYRWGRYAGILRGDPAGPVGQRRMGIGEGSRQTIGLSQSHGFPQQGAAVLALAVDGEGPQGHDLDGHPAQLESPADGGGAVQDLQGGVPFLIGEGQVSMGQGLEVLDSAATISGTFKLG